MKNIGIIAIAGVLVLGWRGGQLESIIVPITQAEQNSNVQAFLRAIRAGESSIGPEGYQMTVYGGSFSDFSKHPNIRKPIPGRPGWYTSAAGAYQITHTTWLALVPLLGTTDFSPATQDRAAILLLKKRGALADVMRGDFLKAAAKCRNEWEAFTNQRLFNKMVAQWQADTGIMVA